MSTTLHDAESEIPNATGGQLKRQDQPNRYGPRLADVHYHKSTYLGQRRRSARLPARAQHHDGGYGLHARELSRRRLFTIYAIVVCVGQWPLWAVDTADPGRQGVLIEMK